jgi:hypothetical protein
MSLIIALLIIYFVPAYCITLALKFGIVERMVVGVLLVAGLTGLLSYFAGMFGLGYYHPYVISIMISVIGLVLYKWRRK